MNHGAFCCYRLPLHTSHVIATEAVSGRPSVTFTQSQIGDAIIFDYRVLHRGLANGGSHPRPVFYLALGKPGRADTSNFPATQLADPPLLMEDTVAGDHK